MTNRREFLARTAAGVMVASSSPLAGAAEEKAIARPTGALTKGPRIQSVIRREETIRRYESIGDNWHMSWANDDRQYVSLCDGFDLADLAKGMYSSRVFALNGDPREARLENLPGYPELVPQGGQTRYYGFGTLALDGHIYQFLTHFHSAVKLIYSSDNGCTWHNQDGSTPVRWESSDRHSHDTMVFLDEPQKAFVLLSVLQMGRNYQFNRDGYVYVYAPNGATEGTMNELVMFRVPKACILDRSAYEFFAGRQGDNSARWTKDIDARAIVHTFPSGWVGKGTYSWQPSVTYNAPLGLYMMANWGWDYGDVRISQLASSSKPSYLGFWTAPNPWGPWTQIHEETAWMPGNDPLARAYQPQIAPKWIAPDGKSFWLVWTDYQIKDGFERYQSEFKEKFSRQQMMDADWSHYAAMLHKHMRYYSFNAQRVDLI